MRRYCNCKPLAILENHQKLLYNPHRHASPSDAIRRQEDGACSGQRQNNEFHRIRFRFINQRQPVPFYYRLPFLAGLNTIYKIYIYNYPTINV